MITAICPPSPPPQKKDCPYLSTNRLFFSIVSRHHGPFLLFWQSSNIKSGRKGNKTNYTVPIYNYDNYNHNYKLNNFGEYLYKIFSFEDKFNLLAGPYPISWLAVQNPKERTEFDSVTVTSMLCCLPWGTRTPWIEARKDKRKIITVNNNTMDCINWKLLLSWRFKRQSFDRTRAKTPKKG